jgi:hypothetical protein
MRARQRSSSMWSLFAVLPLGAAMALGCEGRIVPGTPGSGASPGSSGTGGTSSGSGGGSCSATSPELAAAPQRVMLLTKQQVVNTVRYLIDDKEATDIAASDMFEIPSETDKHFPPSDGEVQNMNETSIIPFNRLSEHVAGYVTTNFTTLAKCPSPSDSCAMTYLNALAARAYRRPLTSDEATRFTGLYDTLRSQMVNGYAVTNSVEQATGYAVWGLMMSPQLLWRWELGGKAMAASLPGTYLTDDELASQVSFFLTNQPPDDMLLTSAKAGMLRTNLASHINRILQTPASKTWLRHVMELYFLLNQTTNSSADPGKFPVDPGLLASMATDAQMFLDDILWSGTLKDLMLSRTAYVNTRLADIVYKIPQPSGATQDNFVKVTLPSDQRSGILTNAGFLAARSRSDGQDLISRAKTVKAAFLCLIPPAPNLDLLGDKIAAASGMFNQQTGQEQAAARAAVSPCNGCHALFDSYGLPLEFYDAIGRYRTTYDYLNDKPIDGTATLPAEAGSKVVHNTIDLAQALADSPGFTNCVAKSMLQYSLTEFNGVNVPLPSESGGCAVADVVQRYQAGGGKTFTAMLTAVTQSPAFVVRSLTP